MGCQRWSAPEAGRLDGMCNVRGSTGEQRLRVEVGNTAFFTVTYLQGARALQSGLRVARW